MSQIKECIQSLAHFLTATLGKQVLVSAETFRQGKFDGPEVTRPLWLLMYHLLQFQGTCEEPTSTDSQPTNEVAVTTVKAWLYLHGYQSPELLALPTSMRHGSRELLLAFGWLLASTDIISRLSQPPSHLLMEDTDYVHTVVRGQTTSVEDTTTRERINVSSVTELDKLSVWLLGKLRLALRSLHGACLEKSVLTHKIHKYTVGQSLVPSRSHLSPRDVYLLRHVNHVDKYLSELEREVKRQEALLRWTVHQDIFWQWMESVLDAKLTSAQPSPTSEDVSFSQTEGSSVQDLTHILETLSLGLLSHIDTVEDLLNTTNETWNEKQNQNSTHASLELSEEQRLVTETNLMSSMEFRTRRKPPVPMQLILAQKETKDKKTKKPTFEEEGREEVEGWLRRWSELVDGYRWELEHVRDRHKEELTTLTRSLDEVICIPPMVVKF